MLCGRFPFWGKTDIEYMQSLSRGPCMEGEGWDEVTVQGKEFLLKLLAMDPKERLTAEEALRHPWILKEDPQFNRRLSSINGLALIANKMKQKMVVNEVPAEVQDGKSTFTSPTDENGDCEAITNVVETSRTKIEKTHYADAPDDGFEDDESGIIGTRV